VNGPDREGIRITSGTKRDPWVDGQTTGGLLGLGRLNATEQCFKRFSGNEAHTIGGEHG
jgi:hypothetical protein